MQGATGTHRRSSNPTERSVHDAGEAEKPESPENSPRRLSPGALEELRRRFPLDDRPVIMDFVLTGIFPTEPLETETVLDYLVSHAKDEDDSLMCETLGGLHIEGLTLTLPSERSKYLPYLTSLRDLKITNVNFGDQDLRDEIKVINRLICNGKLSAVSLECCRLAPQFWVSFCIGLRSNTTLQSLNLAELDLENSRLSQICLALEKNPKHQIKSLFIPRNPNLSDKSLSRALIKAFPSGLEELDISGNTPEPLADFLDHVIKRFKLRRLTASDLTSCPTVNLPKLFGDALRIEQFQELIACNITPHTAQSNVMLHFNTGLAGNTQLTTLDLRNWKFPRSPDSDPLQGLECEEFITRCIAHPKLVDAKIDWISDAQNQRLKEGLQKKSSPLRHMCYSLFESIGLPPEIGGYVSEHLNLEDSSQLSHVNRRTATVGQHKSDERSSEAANSLIKRIKAFPEEIQDSWFVECGPMLQSDIERVTEEIAQWCEGNGASEVIRRVKKLAGLIPEFRDSYELAPVVEAPQDEVGEFAESIVNLLSGFEGDTQEAAKIIRKRLEQVLKEAQDPDQYLQALIDRVTELLDNGSYPNGESMIDWLHGFAKKEGI